MKKFSLLLLILGLSSFLSANVNARGNTVYEETYHIGLLGGSIDGGAEFGSVEASGFVFSARNKKAILEYVNLSSSSGNIINTSDTWESNVSGIYLSLIGQGQPYMKFKVGSIKHEYIRTAGTSILPESQSITSYGLGFGYKVASRLLIEFDITTLDKEMTLMALTILF